MSPDEIIQETAARCALPVDAVEVTFSRRLDPTNLSIYIDLFVGPTKGIRTPPCGYHRLHAGGVTPAQAITDAERQIAAHNLYAEHELASARRRRVRKGA